MRLLGQQCFYRLRRFGMRWTGRIPIETKIGVGVEIVRITTHLQVAHRNKECVELYLHSPIRLHEVVLG